MVLDLKVKVLMIVLFDKNMRFYLFGYEVEDFYVI